MAGEGEKVAAKAHFEAATRLYDIHEYVKALEEYKAAYLAKPDPAFLFNVGQCYRRLGKFDQALEFYREYLKKTPPDDPNRANVEARIKDTDNSDVFENDAPPKLTEPKTHPQPIPAQSPPVQPAPVPVLGPPVVERPVGDVVETPVPEVGSSGLGIQSSQAPSLPAAAHPAAGKTAGLDLNVVEPAVQVRPSTPFYRTWWFWTGVGAAVVAGTVATIVLSQSGNAGKTAQTALGTQPVFQ